MDFYKIMAIISPFISAGLTGWLTLNTTMKSKKADLLYQSKIPAFKELSAKLVNYKNFCLGKMAYYEGNEYAPYWEEGAGTMHHRTEIAMTASLHSIYFSAAARNSIDNLMNDMSGLCGAELQILGGNDMPDLKDAYFKMQKQTDDCINKLYDELNLKD